MKNDKTWNGAEDTLFLAGYDEMLNLLDPKTIIIYGSMIDGLEGNIINVPSYYMEKSKGWREDNANGERIQ